MESQNNKAREENANEDLNSPEKDKLGRKVANRPSEKSNLPLEKNLSALIDEWLKKPFSINDFQELTDSIKSEDVSKQHYGLIGFSKLVLGDTGAVQEIIGTQLLPTFKEFLEKDNHPFLQLKALYIFAIISDGTEDDAQSILDTGVLPIVIKLLKSKRQDIVSEAIWLIGNLGATSTKIRDTILQSGGLEPLINIILQSLFSNRIINTAVWATSNLCRGRPLPKFELVSASIPAFSKIIQESDDIETLGHACWAMSLLTRGPPKDSIQIMLSTNIVPSLLKYFDTTSMQFLRPLVRIFGNVFSGSAEEVDFLLHQAPGIVDKLYEHLNSTTKGLRREICWELSNLALGTQEQLNYLLDHPSKIDRLVCIMNTDVEEVSKEATWALRNMTSSASPEQMEKLCERNLFENLLKRLDSTDKVQLEVVLDAIYNILKYGDEPTRKLGGQNKFVAILEADGLQKLEELQMHSAPSVYEKVIQILETFFETDENNPNI